VAVSAAALTARGGARGVLLLEGGVAAFRPVEVTGPADADGLLTVVSGLAGGEAVVLDPEDEIVDGTKVRVGAEEAP
jgi:hypothetical protein